MNWKLYLLEWLTPVAERAFTQRTEQALAAGHRYGQESAHATRARARQERAERSYIRLSAALQRMQRGEPT